MANFVSNNDALEVLDKYAKGIKKGIGVVAVRETSPAAAAHAVGDYIRYSGTVYKVKSAISIGDSLILNTNIEANDLPDDTTIYTPGLDEENSWRDITSQCTFNTTDLSFYNQKVFDNGFAYLVTGLLTNIQNISDMTTMITLPRNAIARGGQSGVTSGNFGAVEDVRVAIGIAPNTNIVSMGVGNWSATGSRNFVFSFLVPHA